MRTTITMTPTKLLLSLGKVTAAEKPAAIAGVRSVLNVVRKVARERLASHGMKQMGRALRLFVGADELKQGGMGKYKVGGALAFSRKTRYMGSHNRKTGPSYIAHLVEFGHAPITAPGGKLLRVATGGHRRVLIKHTAAARAFPFMRPALDAVKSRVDVLFSKGWNKAMAASTARGGK